MSALRAIHAKRRQVHSLNEDDTWRDFVEKHTGQRSTRGLSHKQSNALLAALDDMGAGKITRKRSTLSGPYAKKIQALWISCWNLGLIGSRDDAALNNFAVKQAKVDHANWIREQDDAVAVIEALKKMLERRGVEWSGHRGDPSYMRAPGFKIAAAQWELIKGEAPYAGDTFRGFVYRLTHRNLPDLKDADWITVMNTFGETVRTLKSEGAL
ncbi:regulatory protein GemA [Cognatishimia sp. MH4019]|uniref:regulatory protein GemA n=1 Tax=Cognatishimia sp. MH4019 TaxID=2854030 RepID=UPI001CD3B05F|nr:regulatory protein GemA [Cognatishimia sp. MH4019]